jgi:integrase
MELDAGKVCVARQLITPGPQPVFGPPRRRKVRSIDLSAETVRLLREHKRHQAELKMANRTTYRDLGLVFAKEHADVLNQHECVGHPLQSNNLGEGEFARVIKAAGVKSIPFRGLRHRAATLMFAAGVPVKVIQERLGHAGIEITLGTYTHVLPTMGAEAAKQVAAVLG